MIETQTNVLNGVNLDQLVGTVNAIQNDPEIAVFKFRSSTEWIDGGHSRTMIKDFYGAKQEDTSRAKPFIIEGDEPAVLLGKDKGINAVESVLQALASCVTVGIVYNSAAKGIKVNSLNFVLEGDLDLRAFLGLSEDVRPGYSNIQMNIELDADATAEQLDELLQYVQKTSPVLDIIRNPVPVKIKMV